MHFHLQQPFLISSLLYGDAAVYHTHAVTADLVVPQPADHQGIRNNPLVFHLWYPIYEHNVPLAVMGSEHQVQYAWVRLLPLVSQQVASLPPPQRTASSVAEALLA